MEKYWGTLHFVMLCDPKNALEYKTLKSDLSLGKKKEGGKEKEISMGMPV